MFRQMGASTGDDRTLDEWKEARSILGRFDTNLHDLRKYGFSFITALLAANGLLDQGSTAYTPIIKATVLITTIGLIVALRLLDKHYRLFQDAASLRARMLENRLNLDITNDISVYYDLQGWWKYVQWLYYAFIGLAVLVGVAILWQDWLLILGVIVFAVVSAILIHLIDRDQPTAVADWSVDKKVVTKGNPVRITFTNLDRANIRDPKNPERSVEGVFVFSWKVLPEGEPGAQPLGQSNRQTGSLFYLEDRDWLWDTFEVDEGLYWLEMIAEKPSNIPRAAKASPVTPGTSSDVTGLISVGEAGPLVAHHTVRMTIQVE